MSGSEPGWSRIGENRFAFAVVAASLVAGASLVGLYWIDLFDPFLPALLPDITTLPLYVIGVVAVIGIVVWSWRRVASFFE